jgi:peptidoglycan hydrolase-like protein with peptidoglycan-binding domain
MGVKPMTFEQAHVKSSFPLPVGQVYATNAHNGKASPTDKHNVSLIQKRLSVKMTGWYGPITTTKVRAWQVWKKIKPTGAVGRVTWDRMFPPS